MVNAVRSALLNLPAYVGSDRPVAEEYVPSTYVPKRLTGTLATARAALFGAGADRSGMNITLARLLAYLHGSSFHADVTADDARITYDVTAGPGVFSVIGPSVTGPAYAGWVGLSTFAAPGRGYGAWNVTTDGSGGYTVTPSGSDAPTAGSVGVTDLGDSVPLSGSLLGLVVPTGAAGTWSVVLVAPPTHAFSALADLPDAAALFRPSGSDTDRRCHAAWIGDGADYHRAAAAALALAARTTELGI